MYIGKSSTGTTAPSSDILKQLAREVARTPQEQVMEVGDRNTNSNLRYKHGRNLTYVNRDVLVVKDPATIFLPRANVARFTSSPSATASSCTRTTTITLCRTSVTPSSMVVFRWKRCWCIVWF